MRGASVPRGCTKARLLLCVVLVVVLNLLFTLNTDQLVPLLEPLQGRPDPVTLSQDFIASVVNASKTRGDAAVSLVFWWPGNWAGLGTAKYTTPNYLGTNLTRKKCDMGCTLSSVKERWQGADAILLEISVTGMNEYPWQHPPLLPHKYPSQPWIIFSYEQEDYFKVQKDKLFLSSVDMRATYHADSEIPITFACPWAGSTLEDYLKPQKKLTEDGTERKGIIFVQSNCGNGGAASRTAYVRELMKYIQVDSYGHCLRNTELPSWWSTEKSHGGLMGEKIRLFSQYKFVLAFENNNITDYVTEKLPNAFLGGALPIYMGAPNIDEWVPGQMSIIRTADFNGPQALARYIKHLDQNPKSYNEYFIWKSQPLLPSFLKKWSQCVFTDSLCRMCNHVWERNVRNILSSVPLPSQDENIAASMVSDLLRKKKELRLFPKHVLFDGNTTIRIPYRSSMIVRNRFTIAMWIKIDEHQQGHRLVDANTAGSLIGYNFDLFNPHEASAKDETFLRLCTASGCIIGWRPIFKEWTHIAVVFNVPEDERDVGKIIFYVNGVVDSTHQAFSPIDSVQGVDIVIGGASIDPGNTPHIKFKGSIDNLGIWKRVLSPQEIIKLPFGGQEQTQLPQSEGEEERREWWKKRGDLDGDRATGRREVIPHNNEEKEEDKSVGEDEVKERREENIKREISAGPWEGWVWPTAPRPSCSQSHQADLILYFSFDVKDSLPDGSCYEHHANVEGNLQWREDAQKPLHLQLPTWEK